MLQNTVLNIDMILTLCATRALDVRCTISAFHNALRVII